MLYASREIEGGVSEAAAFENFGKRVGQKHYVKLTALLTQSLQKGNTQLFNTLRQEVTALSEERSAASRRKGEEASTRLLFPMMLMLAMTMVLIMRKKKGFQDFLREEDGMGTVEVILIIVVLVGLVILFKSQITTIVQSLFGKITAETDKL